MEIARSGMIAVVGRPNAGKSTLINTLTGEKVAIVSDKPQTTRNRICAIVERDGTQFVFMDTPGFHKAQSRLGEYMTEVVRQSLVDVDAAVLVVEPQARVGTPERMLLEGLEQGGVPVVLAVNKTDTVKKKNLLAVIAAYTEKHVFCAVVPISAKTGEGTDALIKELMPFMPEGPRLFPEGMTSDQPEKRILSELIREKMLMLLEREVPHGIAVEIEKFETDEKGVVHVGAVIVCDKESHKGIIIGKKGLMLKKIGQLARADMERMLGVKVFLETWVKVKPNWRDDPMRLRDYGYQ